jgi:hypothetical protein
LLLKLRDLFLFLNSATQDKETAESGQAKAHFSKAMKAIKTFKRATTVVRATRRFKRGPLNTILKIPQEEAMAKIMEENHKQLESETKDLHRCASGQVATHLKSTREEENLSQRISQLQLEQAKQTLEERTSKLRHTVCHLMPDTT